jgi:hypothetical protein
MRERTGRTERPPLVGEASANFAVVSTTDTHGRILGLLDRGRHFLLQAAPQLYSRG